MQYTVHVSEPNAGLANLMLEQFGGAKVNLLRRAASTLKRSARTILAERTCFLLLQRRSSATLK